jgi:putative ABC transport system permease protein
MTLVLRSTGDPSSLAAPLRRIVRGADPRQALTRVGAYDGVVAATTGTRRFASALLVVFAGSALALALVGLYGAVGVAVGQRRREIGLRIALGARAGQIRRMVVAQGMRPVGAGLALGIALAALATGALRSLLYGVTPLDPETFAGAGALLAAGALVACFIPAWRAARTDPAETLRAE